MPPQPVKLLVLVVGVAFLSLFAGHLAQKATASCNVAALDQLAQTVTQSMGQFFAKTGSYPKSLAELSLDFPPADTERQADLKHATYLTEALSAIVILERPDTSSVLLVFHDGKLVQKKTLGGRSDE